MNSQEDLPRWLQEPVPHFFYFLLIAQLIFNSRCRVHFIKPVAVSTSLVDYISWLVDYRGNRLTDSGFYTHSRLHQLASRLSGQQINRFRILHTCHVNHCHAIMDIIKNISNTLNQQQSPPFLMMGKLAQNNKPFSPFGYDQKQGKKTMQKIANLNEVYS